MDRYNDIRTVVENELQTRRDDEGCSPKQLADLKARFAALKEEGSQGELEALYQELLQIQPQDPQPWEPSDLQQIQDARPRGPRRLDSQLSDERLLDKVLGGWLGRAAGCVLGKPVEGWSRANIEAYLEACGEGDLAGFFPYLENPPADLPVAIGQHGRQSCRGHIKFMPRDDDMDYTVIGLEVLKRKGPQFRTSDVAQIWLEKLPFLCTYTAERVAYLNLVAGRTPPETAYHRNPYRQWIGAQIRADAFGYACPGDAESAAALAWKDARLSHVKNGIYGEMWVAAAIAAAFVSSDIVEVVEVATSEIPKESRFKTMVDQVLRWHEDLDDWKACWSKINEHYGHLHGVHTINNAALVLTALLYGEKDFGRTVSIAVQGGWDTDCNGATAGSILGVMLGASHLPKPWTEPLNDTLETAVFGYNYPKLSDLAAATCKVARAVERK